MILNLNLINSQLFKTKFCCVLKDNLLSGSTQCVSYDKSRLHQRASTSRFYKLNYTGNAQKLSDSDFCMIVRSKWKVKYGCSIDLCNVSNIA